MRSDHPTAIVPVGELHVRTLYDYEADDGTSLSFHQGDVIQVLTQLDTGWWYGIMNIGTENEARGWFPSNYCTIVPSGLLTNDGIAATGSVVGSDYDGDDDVYGDASDDDHEGRDYVNKVNGNAYTRDQTSTQSLESNGTGATAITTPDRQQNGGDEEDEDGEQEDAAFWIPQVTSDGSLYYVNTLTGVTNLDLPLAAPTSANETGPQNRTNVNLPERTRLPPEYLARGFERNEVDPSYEKSNADMDGFPGKRHSYTSDGVSPATSMESINTGSPVRSRHEPRDQLSSTFSTSQTLAPHGSMSGNSFSSNSQTRPPFQPVTSRQYYDASQAVPLTWNRLVEDMRRAVERYRRAINNSDRSEFVKRAEDISDHLRLLLAAGSGTTDNHSGNPSIISTNRPLYPHFREMMSRFSKLVLSSHIAAADWPTPDSYAKCLQEADGVLNGVYGFVEVARQQGGGEDIPRLVPGFVYGSRVGGNWQNNGIRSPYQANELSFVDQDDYENTYEPSNRLDAYTLGQVNECKRAIVSHLRRLEGLLVVRDKIVTTVAHQQISDGICKAAKSVLELYRPWIGTVESVDLSSFSGKNVQQSPQLNDLAVQKQRVYDLVSELVIACQGVAAPLADEWAELKLASLEERLGYVRTVCGDLEASTQQVYNLMQLLSEMKPQTVVGSGKENGWKKGNAGTLGSIGPDYLLRNNKRLSPSIYDGKDGPTTGHKGDPGKLEKILGDKPPQLRQEQPDFLPPSIGGEMPDFLSLDYENELVFDKGLLKGGSLISLVEQLTRHDKLDTDFNDTFLLNYRSFTSAPELVEMLMRRWSIQPPLGLSQDEFRLWVDRKQKLIRIRVVKILKDWVEGHWTEPKTEESQALLQRLLAFGKEIIPLVGTVQAAQLIGAVEQRMSGQEPKNKGLIPTTNQPAPNPILPRNMRKLKFLDIDVTELARQLTIIDSRLYSRIRRTECLGNGWQKKLGPDEADPSPNVKAVILNSNQLSNWVAQMILTQEDVKRRVVVIKQFVQVADKCRELNNYASLFAIICAFATSPISRLKKTWEAVNRRTMNLLDSMRDLMDSRRHFRRYRDALAELNPPCVPFIGLYLTELTFIEDGIPSLLRGYSAINFAKFTKTTEVMREIQRFQSQPYALQTVPELQEYIAENMRTAGDVNTMYDRSLAVEPREQQKEREDDRIARLLSESGFL